MHKPSSSLQTIPPLPPPTFLCCYKIWLELAKVPQLTYTCPGAEQGLRHVARCFILIAEIAVRLLRLQSDCLDCSQIAEIAKVSQLTIHATAPNKGSGMLLGVLF